MPGRLLDMELEEPLIGGVNAVRAIGSTVVRPAAAHSPSVHRLLRHLRDSGFQDAPEPLSLNESEGIETLSFLYGEVANYPLPPSFKTDEDLIAAAELLRRYHDATSDFQTSDNDEWFLPPRQPAQVICHGDFAPYNCALRPDGTLAVFDFDTAHPGPRLWDVGYAVYRWAPLTGSTSPPGSATDLTEQRRRLHLFLSTYGGLNPRPVLDSARARLAALVETMRGLAADGNNAFISHIAAGDDRQYLADIDYIERTTAALAE